MKRLFGLAVAAGVLWAAGCKSTTSQTAGGAVERLPVVESMPVATETPAAAVQTTESKRGVISTLLFSTETGGECSH